MRKIEGKVVALGSQGVGKTSMILRYVGKMFNQHVNPTIGASFFTCKLNIENTRVQLQVWDTAGQERFRSMAPMYYRNANAAMLVFDLTQYNTFATMKTWVGELRRNVEDVMILAVIGNKSDLTDQRQVNEDEGRTYATQIGASYHETSVIQDKGIESVFLTIATGLLKTSDYEFAYDTSDTMVNPTTSIRIYCDSASSASNSTTGYLSRTPTASTLGDLSSPASSNANDDALRKRPSTCCQ